MPRTWNPDPEARSVVRCPVWGHSWMALKQCRARQSGKACAGDGSCVVIDRHTPESDSFTLVVCGEPILHHFLQPTSGNSESYGELGSSPLYYVDTNGTSKQAPGGIALAKLANPPGLVKTGR